jgi:hypothetical protein
MSLDFATRRCVAETLRNVIGPGRRALFSTEIQSALHQAITEQLGNGWETDIRQRDALRTRYDGIAEGYRKRRPPEYDEIDAAAYTLTYLPLNLHKIQYILLDLHLADCLPESLRSWISVEAQAQSP